MAYRIRKCLLTDRLRQVGMTQTDLADRLGVKKQLVGKWARGEQGLSVESAKNVSTILKLESMDELYEWVWVPKRNK